jgi:hypothetical protein
MGSTEEVSEGEDRITRPDIPGLVIPVRDDDEAHTDAPSSSQRAAQPATPAT